MLFSLYVNNNNDNNIYFQDSFHHAHTSGQAVISGILYCIVSVTNTAWEEHLISRNEEINNSGSNT